MKKRSIRTIAILMVMVLFVTTTASAIRIVDEAEVYVDGRQKNVDAFVNSDDEICVYDVDDIYYILPELEDEDYYISPSRDYYVVSKYVEYLDGYSYTIQGDTIYIYSGVIDNGDITGGDNNGDDNDSNWDDYEDANVFVNGMRTYTRTAYVDGSNAFVDDVYDVYLIFEEARNSHVRFETDRINIRQLASRYGYSYVLQDNNVYLNNDRNDPVQIYADGEEMYFPDQQPVIVPAGRTMVPIRFVAEYTGADVTWDGANKRVIIEDGYNKITIWQGKTLCHINGRYYDDLLDVAPYETHARTMVPLRFVLENLGYTVRYDSSQNVDIVRLSSIW